LGLKRDLGDIQDIVVVGFEGSERMVLPRSPGSKVVRMQSIDSNSRFESESRKVDIVRERLAGDEDLVMEQILDNINSTPIGQVLKKIASLPEVRKEKVLDLRRQITKGEYDLNERLDVAVDKFLEQLTT
jgi:hypothetical protein